jgi:NAD(P)-dependent dehydrogenase (short-subunit alcohol dehydrogenase family)
MRADLAGKTCVVTGASSGIGRAAARELARLGARVVLAVRDPRRGDTARREIVAATGNPEVDVMRVDVAHQRSIHAFARDFAVRHPRLDALVNNAGIWTERRRTSPDGIELTWATNVLGYHLLTALLLPALRTAGRARVVNVASQLAGDLDLTDVEFERRRYSGRSAYAQSKQADRMLTWALARRLKGSGVTANAMHPGFVATGIFAKGGGLVGLSAALYAKMKAKPPEEGADTVVWLAASAEVEGRSGVFWIDRQERRCRFRSTDAEERLWALCDTMTGLSTLPQRCAAPAGRP